MTWAAGIEESSCPLCGWHYFRDRDASPEWYEQNDYYPAPGEKVRISILKTFDVNSPQVALRELGAHLKRRYRDIYGLDPRRFEEIVADIFRAHGFDVQLTRMSRDGGVDLLIFHHSRDRLSAIVECKRYADTRKVGVEIVRTLVGAAVDWGVSKAYLVTSSDFSNAAKTLASSYIGRGYELDLVSASDLLKLLDVYNEKLPPLNLLTEEARMVLVRANRSSTTR